MDDSGIPIARDEVHRRWLARQGPDGDFIVFADGSLSVMRLVRCSPSDRLNDPQAEQWHWDEILRATVWTAGEWVDVDCVLASCAYGPSRALAGESSSHGSVGWVALTGNDDEGTLEWLAISSWSNPFVRITLDDSTVTATSTAGRVWVFPRNAPQQVEITEDAAHPWHR